MDLFIIPFILAAIVVLIKSASLAALFVYVTL